MQDVAQQLELIKRGAMEIISEDLLKEKLTRSLTTGKPLVIKAGFDPSAPDIHLGHTVLLRKMRHFQQLGHRVVFLIGDFTGMIGDPTGKSEIRKQLTREQVIENAQSYQQQVIKILDPQKTEVVFNSDWLGKMTPYDFLRLSAQITVAQMLAREDFKQRYSQGKDISLLEFMYPLLQGYDSVALKADVELGGTDQKFNLLVGRQMQKDYGQEQQVVLTMPLLEGLDGVQKMSKSLGNYVGINEAPEDMYGKLMSISDVLMFRYYELLTDIPLKDIAQLRQDITTGALHPKTCKENLAHMITEFYHAKAGADHAAELFRQRFGKGQAADNAQMYEIVSIAAKEWQDGKLWICKLLTLAGCVKSNSDARRLVQQQAVTLDGAKVTDAGLELARPDTTAGGAYLLKVGKKQFIRIQVDG